jgi:hypothetical protein
MIVNTPSSVPNEDDEEDDDDADLHHALPTSNSKRTGRRTIDDDAKSHMSELTEDRTQKQFDVYMYHGSTQRPLAASPRNVPHQTNLGAGPPSIIGVAEDPRSEQQAGHPTIPKKDTIMTAHKSSILQARNPSLPRNDIPRYDVKPHTPRSGGGGADAGSVSSYGSKPKLTVAQRARLEADHQTTPVRVRMQASGSTPIRGNSSSSSRKEPQMRLTPTNIASSSPSNKSSQGSFFSTLGRRLENAIDSSSILNAGDSSSESSDDSGTDIDEDRHQEEKKISETLSEASTVRC